MGVLSEGKWVSNTRYADESGQFNREPTTFRNWVTTDGSSPFAPERGRYHLYVSYACPWATRTLVVRELRRLHDVIPISVVHPYMGPDGWTFAEMDGTIPDTVHGARFLRDVYLRADPRYTGHVTVPVLWDKKTGTIVNNESRDVIRMFDTVFLALGEPEITLCPTDRVSEIDDAITAIYEPINNGVYRAGFASKQEAYDQAVSELFDALDHWEKVLAERPYLCGDRLTEADVCLFTTLYRFDPVYHYHFKCNLRRLRDYPNLWSFTKHVYQIPGVRNVCRMDHVKRHYYTSHEDINPHGIIPKGPILDFDEPHDRGRFRATRKPFG